MLLSYIRNTEVKPKKICDDENNEYRKGVQNEYHPSGYRIPVEEVQSLSPKV